MPGDFNYTGLKPRSSLNYGGLRKKGEPLTTLAEQGKAGPENLFGRELQTKKGKHLELAPATITAAAPTEQEKLTPEDFGFPTDTPIDLQKLAQARRIPQAEPIYQPEISKAPTTGERYAGQPVPVGLEQVPKLVTQDIESAITQQPVVQAGKELAQYAAKLPKRIGILGQRTATPQDVSEVVELLRQPIDISIKALMSGTPGGAGFVSGSEVLKQLAPQQLERIQKSTEPFNTMVDELSTKYPKLKDFPKPLLGLGDTAFQFLLLGGGHDILSNPGKYKADIVETARNVLGKEITDRYDSQTLRDIYARVNQGAATAEEQHLVRTINTAFEKPGEAVRRGVEVVKGKQYHPRTPEFIKNILGEFPETEESLRLIDEQKRQPIRPQPSGKVKGQLEAPAEQPTVPADILAYMREKYPTTAQTVEAVASRGGDYTPQQRNAIKSIIAEFKKSQEPPPDVTPVSNIGGEPKPPVAPASAAEPIPRGYMENALIQSGEDRALVKKLGYSELEGLFRQKGLHEVKAPLNELPKSELDKRVASGEITQQEADEAFSQRGDVNKKFVEDLKKKQEAPAPFVGDVSEEEPPEATARAKPPETEWSDEDIDKGIAEQKPDRMEELRKKWDAFSVDSKKPYSLKSLPFPFKKGDITLEEWLELRVPHLIAEGLSEDRAVEILTPFYDQRIERLPRDKFGNIKAASYKKPPAAQPETNDPRAVVKSLLDRYDEGDEKIATVSDIVDNIENEDIPELSDAVDKFRDEQEDDRKLGGRGDMESAEEDFLKAVDKYLKGKKPEAPVSPDYTGLKKKGGKSLEDEIASEHENIDLAIEGANASPDKKFEGVGVEQLKGDKELLKYSPYEYFKLLAGRYAVQAKMTGDPTVTKLAAEYERLAKLAEKPKEVAKKKGETPAFSVGDTVRHNIYGSGKILKLYPKTGEAFVDFQAGKYTVSAKALLESEQPSKPVSSLDERKIDEYTSNAGKRTKESIDKSEPIIKALEDEAKTAIDAGDQEAARKAIAKIDHVLNGLYGKEGETEKDITEIGSRAPERNFKKDLRAFGESLRQNLSYEYGLDKKGKKELPDTNIAPIGGDGTIILWKPNSNYGVYVSVPVDYDSDSEGLVVRGTLGDSSVIMWRATSKADKFTGFTNQWAPANISAQQLASLAKKEVDYWESLSKEEAKKQQNLEIHSGLTGTQPPPRTKTKTDFAGLTKTEETPILPSEKGEGERAEGVGATSPESLEDTPAEKVRPTPELRPPAQRGIERGATNTRGDAGVTRGRREPSGGVGEGEGEVPVSPRGETGEVGQDADLRPLRRDRDDGGTGGSRNYQITDNDRLGQGSIGEKFTDNISAIKLVLELEKQQRQATPEEQSLLARYVGWGGMKAVFPRSDGTFPKGWESRNEELKELLTPEEYAAAARSTLDAHYTSEPVIRAIYDILQRLGFDQGKILESSVGTGNFFGLMPRQMMNKSELTGVELDRITSLIAKHLYPQANIITSTGFQDAVLSDMYFDASVGNPPFGGQTIPYGTSKHLKGFSKHNYFFAKIVDKLRPGGVLVNVITKSFLDKSGEKQRSYIADRVKFIGAIRLPNTAFQENANTEVTTDIVVLQKLPESEWKTSDRKWITTGTVPDPLGGDPIPLNQYFIDHPEMMLGRMERSGKMRFANEPTLAPTEGQDIQKALDEAIARLPQDIYTSSGTVRPTEEMEIAATDLPPEMGKYPSGSFMFSPDGTRIIQRIASGDGTVKGVEITAESQWSENRQWGQNRVMRLRGMIEIRDAVRNQIQLESADMPKKDIEAARKHLNSLYDRFVEKHGYISSRGNQQIIADDHDLPLLLSLEEDFDSGVSKDRAKQLKVPAREPSAKKTDIFRRRVVGGITKRTKADTPKDGLFISLADKGGVDIPHIAKLTGKSEDEVIDELTSGDTPLVYKDPATNEYVTSDEYLSGNVKGKAKIAQQNGLSKHYEALRNVFPKDVAAGDIRIHLSTPWIPGTDYEQFAKDLLGEGTRAAVRFLKHTGGFNVRIEGGSQTKQRNEFGTDRIAAGDILNKVLNNKDIVIRDTMPDKTSVVNVEATAAAREKADAIRNAFEEWVFKDPDRRERLVKYYNDNVNVNVQPVYDGQHLTLPGKVPDAIIKFRKHQNDAVWRTIRDRKALYDHVVGSGKTFTMIASAMELKRLGFARKSMVIVPNHLVEQWGADWLRLYPGAKILAMKKKDFEKQNRREMLSRIATGDWDAVVIAHSSFGFIPVQRELLVEFLKKQIDEIQATIDEVREVEGKKTRTVAAMEAKLKELLDKPKDDILTFEELGVDQVFVDESQEFKNLFFSTGRQGARGLGNPKGSKRALDLFIKTQWLQKKQKGKGVVFATGTPISNSLSEMYTLERYLGMDELERLDIKSFDAWLNTYGSMTSDYELDGTGVKYKSVERLRMLQNMPTLMARYRQFTDSVTQDDIQRVWKEQTGKDFPIPKVTGGKRNNVVVPISPDQEEYFKIIVQRAEAISKHRGPPQKGEDNMLAVTMDARKAALDMRLIDPSYPDNPKGKITNVADRITEKLAKTKKDRGTQLVFCDLSVPLKAARREMAEIMKQIKLAEEGDEAAQEALSKMTPDEISSAQSAIAGFSVYDDLKKKLIERGVPEREIAFIHDANTDTQKADLFEQVNAGRVRVLIGSTAKMGAGTNVQKRLVAAYHLDCPWRPSDVEQREGRIIRQGNELYAQDPENFSVDIAAFATERTYDARMWQVQEQKLLGIEAIRNYTGQIEMEEVAAAAATAAEMKAEASGNPLILEDVQLSEQIRRLKMAERRARTNEYDLQDKLKKYTSEIERIPKRLEIIKGDIEQAKKYTADPFDGNPPKGTVNGKEFTTYASAANEAWTSIRNQKAAQGVTEEIEAKEQEKEDREKSQVENRNLRKWLTDVKKISPKEADRAMMGGKLNAEATKEFKEWEKQHGEKYVQPKKGRAKYEVDINGEKITSEADLIDALAKTWGDKEPFVMKVGGKKYLRSREVAAAIQPKVQKYLVDHETKPMKLGEIGGFDVEIDNEQASDVSYYVTLRSPATDQDYSLWTSFELSKIHAVGARVVDFAERIITTTIPHQATELKFQLETAQRELPSIKENVGKGFAKAEELAAKEKRHAEVRRLLSEKPKEEEPPTPPEDDLSGATFVTLPGIPEALQYGRLFVDKVGKPLFELYKKPPEVTEYKKIAGKYLGDRQKSDQQLSQQARAINKQFPKLSQRAMARWIEAVGDEDLLRGWMNNAATPDLRRVYEKALELSENEKRFAQEGVKIFRQGFDMAVAHGILEEGVENYFPHLGWEKPTDDMKKVLSQINAGELQKNPKFALRRIFDTFFEGESVGKRSKAGTDTFGFGIVAWIRSLNEAIASRQFLKDLMKTVEADGRPTVVVAGKGSSVLSEEDIERLQEGFRRQANDPNFKEWLRRKGLTESSWEELATNQAYLVKPNARPDNTADYQYINHPALRKWKWATNDYLGNPILVEGNMLIHPAAYPKLFAILGKSKIRTYTVPLGVPIIGGTQPGAAALKASAFVKGTILIGPFHQTHMAEHALFHTVNPFNPREIDFDQRPILKELVDHGLMLFNHNALEEFSEGLASGGLWHKVPGLGYVLKGYQEYLFQEYIPRLKAEMAEHAFNRALEYYGHKWTRDQILENVAKQANAAFGEQNYKYMGRNPTTQDFLRLFTLAPDFLEARMRFAGQAARPGGREQLRALFLAAIGMAGIAQIVNVIFGDDHKMHLDKPFTVRIGKTDYTPRSVIGDIWHLLADPRSFVYHRLNPTYTRPMIEIATGRNQYGEKQNLTEATKEILKGFAPIPAQGAIKKKDDETWLHSIMNTVLQSVGVSNLPARAKYEQTMNDILHDRADFHPTPEQKAKRDITDKIANKITSAGEITEDDIAELSRMGLTDAKGNMTSQFQKNLENLIQYSPQQRKFRMLTLDEAIEVYKQMDEKEQKEFFPLIEKKILNSPEYKGLEQE